MGIFASKKEVKKLAIKTENTIDEVTSRISENIKKFNEDIRILDEIIEETTLRAQQNNDKLEALILESSLRTAQLEAKQKADSTRVAKMVELHELMDTFLRTGTCYASANLQIYPKYDAYKKKYGLPKSVRKGNGKSVIDCYE
jgi:hypothetical protein